MPQLKQFTKTIWYFLVLKYISSYGFSSKLFGYLQFPYIILFYKDLLNCYKLIKLRIRMEKTPIQCWPYYSNLFSLVLVTTKVTPNISLSSPVGKFESHHRFLGQCDWLCSMAWFWWFQSTNKIWATLE